MCKHATILTIFFLPETLPAAEKQQFQLSWRDFGFIKVFQSVARPKLGKLFVLTFLSGSTFTIFTFNKIGTVDKELCNRGCIGAPS